jgi:hypothetical protein
VAGSCNYGSELKMAVFWVVALCSLLEVTHYPDDEGGKHL